MSDANAERDAVWDTMVRFRMQVMSRMQSDLAELHARELTLPKWLAVLALVEQGPMTISDLRTHLGRSQAATSELIDALAEKGLVERRVDPSDGRRSVVHPTRSARALARKLEKARRDGFTRVLGHLPPPLLTRLDAVLTDVLDALEQGR